MGAQKTFGFLGLALFCVTASVASAAGYVVTCNGKKNKTELTVPEKQGKVTFILNGNSVDTAKATWIFANDRKGDTIVQEEWAITVDGTESTPKNEYRLENLGTCPDGESVRMRTYQVTKTTKVFLEETACTCKAK